MIGSKGAEKIAAILSKEHISFIKEYCFAEGKIRTYRYDFYLPSLNILIEFDGEQHFNFSKFFYKTREDFLKAKERDRVKNNYALAHHIPLYRIPYFAIDSIQTY